MQDDLKCENKAIFPLSISRLSETNIEEVTKMKRGNAFRIQKYLTIRSP